MGHEPPFEFRMKKSTLSTIDRLTWMSENPYLLESNRRKSKELFLKKFKKRDFPICFLLGSGLIEDSLTSIWWELEGKDLDVHEHIYCQNSRYLTNQYKVQFVFDRRLIDYNTRVLLQDLQRDRNNVSHQLIHNLRFLDKDYEINRFWRLFKVLEDVESNLKDRDPIFDRSRLENWVGGSLWIEKRGGWSGGYEIFKSVLTILNLHPLFTRTPPGHPLRKLVCKRVDPPLSIILDLGDVHFDDNFFEYGTRYLWSMNETQNTEIKISWVKTELRSPILSTYYCRGSKG